MERPARCLPLHALAPMAGLAMTAMLCGCATPSHVHVSRGETAYNAGAYEDALGHYNNALVNRGGNVDARIGLAKTHLKLEEPFHAREQMEMVYSVNPHDPQVVELLAETMIASGDIAGMQALLSSAAQSSGMPADWDRLGRFLMQVGDLDEAKQALLMAAQLDQGQTAQYQVSLAELHKRSGDMASAKVRYRMALYAEPLNEEVKAALRAMGEIPGPTLAIPPTELATASEPAELP